jgi:RNA polymerase primary sigma factor
MIAPIQKRPTRRPGEKKPKTTRQSRGSGTTATERSRAERLAALTIEYIAHRSFRKAGAAATILAPLETPPLQSATPGRVPAGLTPLLRSLYDWRLLTCEEEVYYFRKMNFLKYHASALRKQLDMARPQVGLMDQIEAALAEADQVKNILARVNLRLVVSIAKKFLDASSDLHELISDGNISLLRAIEKFDFARGYKFSTYASYAIRRNFFRSVINARRDRSRYVSGDDELLKVSAQQASGEEISESQLSRLQITMGEMVNTLNPREQLIISLRFGMGHSGEEQTLQQIARALGVCKERVRQLQSRALEKLHKAARERMGELGELL